MVPPDEQTCRDLLWWQKQYLEGFGVRLPNATNTPPKLRWIARTGSREVRNREAVVQAIRQALNVDIAIVKLETMSPEDQIKVFVESDVIIGPHGAGLAKLFFLRKGAGLLQLAPFGMNFQCWENYDGTVYVKGQNFRNGLQCLGAHYLQYNATWEESGWSRANNTPDGIRDPSSFTYHPPRPFWEYTANKVPGVETANKLYISRKESWFTVDPDVVVGLVKDLLTVISPELREIASP